MIFYCTDLQNKKLKMRPKYLMHSIIRIAEKPSLFNIMAWYAPCMNMRERERGPAHEPLLERKTARDVPANRLSNNPLEAEPELSHEHTNPSPLLVLVVLGCALTIA